MYDLRTFTFTSGKHARREHGLCVMEAVALLAGEPHSDHPQCASPVITTVAIWLNDSCSDELRNELLRDLPWRIVGTRSTDAVEQQRAFMAADWAVRFVSPIVLRRYGLDGAAQKLESLPKVDSAATARIATAAASAAFAFPAAVSANIAASASTAAAATTSAAHACAATSACAAAADLEQIQRSCAVLLDSMIRLTEPQESVPMQETASV